MRPRQTMSRLQRYALGCFLLSFALGAWLQPDNAAVVEGVIVDDDGPVVNATVGWQGERQRVGTDPQGCFRLPTGAKSHRLIASKPGYRIASTMMTKNLRSLRLVPLPHEDHADYAWVDPHPDLAQANNCANCHGEIYREWKQSAHAHSATNPRFLHLLAGSDGKAPVQKNWNALAEHPLGASVCASCHAPTLPSPTFDDVREAQGVARSGIHCDFCHKIADIPTDKLGTRFGIDGVRLLRPANGEQLSFGPLDDAIRAGESFAALPLYKESRYCAACHEGTLFGVHAYGTYSEWLASPAGKRGQQCQHCHMTPTGQMTNIAPGHGGVARDPFALASHHVAGGTPEMLRRSLKTQVRARVVPRGWQVEVEVNAAHVGHRVPTGFVDRQLILLVEATDAEGQRVKLTEGATLPASAGKWATAPGMLYAKQLFGEADRTPVPFWLPVLRCEDTRLHPEQPDRQTFVFASSARQVTVRLWYRRFWQTVADARGWTDNDLLLGEQTVNRDR